MRGHWQTNFPLSGNLEKTMMVQLGQVFSLVSWFLVSGFCGESSLAGTFKVADKVPARQTACHGVKPYPAMFVVPFQACFV